MILIAIPRAVGWLGAELGCMFISCKTVSEVQERRKDRPLVDSLIFSLLLLFFMELFTGMIGLVSLSIPPRLSYKEPLLGGMRAALTAEAI